MLLVTGNWGPMVDPEVGLVRSVVQPIVAGAMGGFGSVLVGHPFETVKARLQTGVKPSWPGFRGIVHLVPCSSLYTPCLTGAFAGRCLCRDVSAADRTGIFSCICPPVARVDICTLAS